MNGALFDASVQDGGRDAEEINDAIADDWRGIDVVTPDAIALVFACDSIDTRNELVRLLEDMGAHLDGGNGTRATWAPHRLAFDVGVTFEPKASERVVPPRPKQLDEWIGLPAFEPAPERISFALAFESEIERDGIAKRLGLIAAKKTYGTWSVRWPPRDQEDLSSLRFDFAGA